MVPFIQYLHLLIPKSVYVLDHDGAVVVVCDYAAGNLKFSGVPSFRASR